MRFLRSFLTWATLVLFAAVALHFSKSSPVHVVETSVVSRIFRDAEARALADASSTDLPGATEKKPGDEPSEAEIYAKLQAQKKTQSVSNLAKAGHFTGDMAKFYLAIGTMQIFECYRTGDPTSCKAFFDSLYDPGTVMGYVLFSVTANAAGKGLIRMSGGRGAVMAGNLGLVAGMLMNDYFSSFWNDPHRKELMATAQIADPARRWSERARIIDELWNDTMTNPDFYYQRIPEVLGLLGAATLTTATIDTALGAVQLTRKTLRLISIGREAGAVVDTARAGAETLRLAVTGYRLIKFGAAGTGIGVLVTIGLTVVETVIFMKWNDWIQTPISAFYKETDALNALVRAEYEFNNTMHKLMKDSKLNTADGADSYIKAEIDAYQTAWDNYRGSFMYLAQETQSEYSENLNSYDDQLRKIYAYYLWIVNGMNPGDDTYKANEGTWHIVAKDGVYAGKPRLEAQKMLKDFVCGSPMEMTIKDSLDWKGFSIPYYREKPVVGAFRVAFEGKPELCVENPKKNSGLAAFLKTVGAAKESSAFQKEAIATYFNKVRMEEITANKDRYSLMLDSDLTSAMFLSNPIRTRIIQRYDQKLQELMASALTGKVATVDTSDYHISSLKDHWFTGDSAGDHLLRVPMFLRVHALGQNTDSIRAGEVDLWEDGHTVHLVSQKDYPRAVLDAFKDEEGALAEWRQKLDGSPWTHLFDDAVKHAKAKEQAANDLYDYVKGPLRAKEAAAKKAAAAGDSSIGDDGVDTGPTTAEWQQMVQLWKSYILQ
jgi:hypothetical protein